MLIVCIKLNVNYCYGLIAPRRVLVPTFLYPPWLCGLSLAGSHTVALIELALV